MAVLRLFFCVPCNARDRIHTLEAGHWWTCVVCQHQLDARDLPVDRAAVIGGMK